MVEGNDSEAHKLYLLQKAQAYKLELDLILNSSKRKVPLGRDIVRTVTLGFVFYRHLKKLVIIYFYSSNYLLKMVTLFLGMLSSLTSKF